MSHQPLHRWLPELLRSAQVVQSDLSHALLSAGAVLKYLADRSLQFQINQIPSSELERNSCLVYGAEISALGLSPCRGYSLGREEDRSAIALLEAFERYVFREVLRRSTQCEFSAHRLLTGEPVALPRKFITGETGVYPSTTSGLSIHANKEAAVLSACLELYERDVLLRNWFAGTAPQAVIPPASQVSEWIENIAGPESFESITGLYRGDCGLPVAVTVLLSTQHRMAFIGTGAALTAEAAIEKAGREALCIWALDFVTWKSGRDLREFPEGNQIRRHHENFDLIQSFFTSNAAHRHSIGDFVDTPLESLHRFLTDYDFSVVQVPVDGFTGLESAPVIVRAYSPKALPLFHGEIPLPLASAFGILKDIKSPDHPY